MAKKLISGTTALSAADNSILTLPARFKGLVRRLSVRNDSGATRTLNFNDQFTPDASAGVSSPSQQTVERRRMVIANATTVELDGTENPIFKLLNNFRVAIDTGSTAVVVSYTIELE
jgi:hypothetical protein